MEQKAISSDLIRGHIDTIILHTLLDGDKYAQQIIDTVEEKSNNQYQLNQATLYSSLKRLELSDYVKSYWFDSDGGRRKYIKITDKGITFVNKNLSNWSFSRAIIDKLIDYKDCTQTAIINDKSTDEPKNSDAQREVRQNIVFVQQNDKQNISEKSINKVNEQSENFFKKSLKQQNAVEYTPVAKTERNVRDFNDKNDEDVTEINFRTILSGLIQASEAENKEIKSLQKEELKPNVDTIQEQSQKQIKFTETISDESVIKREMKNYGGKIDFSDVAAVAEKEGFKVRVSAKNSSKPQGKVYSNKLFFFSSLLIFIVTAAEYFILSRSVQKPLFSPEVTILFAVLAIIFPITSGIIYCKNSRKTIPKHVGGDKLVTSGIVVFNLLLISFAINFILGVDLYDKEKLVRYLLFPCAVSVNILLFFVIEFIFSRTTFFKVKLQK